MQRVQHRLLNGRYERHATQFDEVILRALTLANDDSIVANQVVGRALLSSRSSELSRRRLALRVPTSP